METFIQTEHKEAAIDALKTILSYPSFLQEDPTGKTLFGTAIQEALEATIAITEDLGFRTFIEPEGYYGYAEIGEGEELLAILCHLDVVPPGNLSLWNSDPFKPEVKDGFIIARGTQDDKGPTIAALYAVKALMDAGKTFNKRVRFIFGVDEENLWRCLTRYNEKEETATMGFAPDSTFPVTFAEKGLLQVKLHSNEKSNYRLKAGDAMNVVPEDADYTGELADQLAGELEKLGYNFIQDADHVHVSGKSVHTKNAPEGINAIVQLATALQTIDNRNDLRFLSEMIQEDGRGLAVFGEIKDEASGKLTCNAATLNVTETGSVIGVDIRFPVTIEKALIEEKLQKAAEKYDLTYEEYDYIAPLYVPLDTPLVETLMATYQEKTGDMREAIVSGGATYARTMTNCVAFGAQLPHAEATLHGPNERMALEDIYAAMDIYAEAVYRLACE